MKAELGKDIEITEPVTGRQREILTPEAVEFVARLHRTFNARRETLLEQRAVRQSQLDAGVLLDFLSETREVREGTWKVAPVPKDLQDRRVEITGPVERKMMINALNSGAKIFSLRSACQRGKEGGRGLDRYHCGRGTRADP